MRAPAQSGTVPRLPRPTGSERAERNSRPADQGTRLSLPRHDPCLTGRSWLRQPSPSIVSLPRSGYAGEACVPTSGCFLEPHRPLRMPCPPPLRVACRSLPTQPRTGFLVALGGRRAPGRCGARLATSAVCAAPRNGYHPITLAISGWTCSAIASCLATDGWLSHPPMMTRSTRIAWTPSTPSDS